MPTDPTQEALDLATEEQLLEALSRRSRVLACVWVPYTEEGTASRNIVRGSAMHALGLLEFQCHKVKSMLNQGDHRSPQEGT